MGKDVLGNLKKGLVFIISAPAGTGKTTLVQMLTKEFPCVVASVSHTTRGPRSGEVDGTHYHFVSEDTFLECIAKGEFLEYVQLYDSYYGTSRVWMEEQLEKGRHVLLVIDTQGARQLKGKLEAVSIFIAPPSLEELEHRLIKRQTEEKETVAKRLKWAKEEMALQYFYDYRIVNDDLEGAYQVLRSILIAEEHRLR